MNTQVVYEDALVTKIVEFLQAEGYEFANSVGIALDPKEGSSHLVEFELAPESHTRKRSASVRN